MSYDIFGNYLKPCHCEVHPNVAEPYPCSVCFAEDNKSVPTKEIGLTMTDEELVASMPGTGPCLTEGCDGEYNAFGRCTKCGSVD